MQRRTLFQAGAGLAAGSLASPLLAQGTRAQTLRFVPQANLTALDPIWTTAIVTQMHGYHIYDTLFAMDEQPRPQPQMAEGCETSADGRVWRIRLREGLRFPDGEPVRAADCAAWLDAPDAARQLALANELDKLAQDDVATVPLGQFTMRTAWRRSITGHLKGSMPYPWGVRAA
jgi:ABC-type transport system substrate-binding protein